MNVLDRAIRWVAPASALRRARIRAAMAMLARSYEGARVGRRTEGWVVAGTSANAEIGTALCSPARPLARSGAQQPLRGEGDARGGQQPGRHRDPAAGAGRRRRGQRTADKLWARFAEACDADGLTDFSGLQALVVRAMVESGECLVRIRDRRIEDGLAGAAAAAIAGTGSPRYR